MHSTVDWTDQLEPTHQYDSCGLDKLKGQSGSEILGQTTNAVIAYHLPEARRSTRITTIKAVSKT